MTGQSFGLAVLLLALAAGAAPSPAQAKIIFSENNQTKAIQAGPSLPPVEESQGGYCQDPGMNQRFADALRQCEYQTKEALETCDSKGVNALIGVQKSIGKGSKDVSISGELTQQGRVMLTEKKKSCDRIARLCYATCAEVRSMAERGRCSVLGFEDILKSCESGEAYTRWIQLAGSVVSATTFESGNNEEIPNNEIKPQSTNLASGIRPASTHPAFEDPFAGEPLDEDPLQDSHEQETAIPPPVEIQAAQGKKVAAPTLEYTRLRRLSPLALDRLEAARRTLIEKFQTRLVIQQSQVDKLIKGEQLFRRQSYWHLRNGGRIKEAVRLYPRLHKAYLMKQRYHLLMAKDPAYIRAHEELYLIARVRNQGKAVNMGGNRVPARDPNQMCVCALSDTMELCRLRLSKNGCL